MVKGIAKHAVIVKSPDNKQFEQAIFILSGQEQSGIKSADEMLSLACTLASQYSAKTLPTQKQAKKMHPLAYFAAGGGSALLLMWLAQFLIM